MTTKSRPQINTWKQPEDIVGRENMDIFTRYCEASARLKNYEEKKREAVLNKDFGTETRQIMGDTLSNLHESGFVPGQADISGNVRYRNEHGKFLWSIRTMSDCDEDFYHGKNVLHGPSLQELEKLSSEQLMTICRKKGFAGLVDSMDMQQVTGE